jgi:hypothetical protein
MQGDGRPADIAMLGDGGEGYKKRTIGSADSLCHK